MDIRPLINSKSHQELIRRFQRTKNEYNEYYW